MESRRALPCKQRTRGEETESSSDYLSCHVVMINVIESSTSTSSSIVVDWWYCRTSSL